MNHKLLFDFTVNIETNTVNVKKAFDAECSLIWDAFTKAELLDQWWAPQPWVSKTKSMEFKVGGRRLYAMYGPNGEEHWALADFTSIKPKTNFTFIDAFCDLNGIISDFLPGSDWSLDFLDLGNLAQVNIAIKHKSLADLEKIIELGFKEGFTIALDGLDEILLNLGNQKRNTTKIKVQSTISADIKKVWDYYTNPIHIIHWNFATDSWQCPKAENDMLVGGKYSARMEAKDGSFGFDFEAIYNEISEVEKFTYTMTDGRQASVVFKAIANQTELTVIFDAENENSEEIQRGGWQAILDNFKKYAESN